MRHSLRGAMGAKARAAALARLEPNADGAPLLVLATGSHIGEGFDCRAGYTSRGFPNPRQRLPQKA